MSILFQRLVSSVKDKNFQNTTKLYLTMSFEYYNAYKVVPFDEKPS